MTTKHTSGPSKAECIYCDEHKKRAIKAEAAFALMRELIGVLSNSFDEGDRRRDELRRVYNSAALSVLTEAKGEKP